MFMILKYSESRKFGTNKLRAESSNEGKMVIIYTVRQKVEETINPEK